MKNLFRSGLLCIALSAPAAAEQWISLGDTLGSEMDVSSITRSDDVAFLHMRHRLRNEQGILTMDLNLAVYCGRSFYYIESGQISSSWSSRVVPMPDLPDDGRTFHLPTPNQALNNMYDFVCQ